jgi:hypothetical protein
MNAKSLSYHIGILSVSVAAMLLCATPPHSIAASVDSAPIKLAVFDFELEDFQRRSIDCG